MKDYIVEKRESLGLSIRAFSRLIGFSYQTVSDWEKGNHLPPINSVKRIISRLKLDEEEEARLWRAHSRVKQVQPIERRGRTSPKEKSIREVPGWIERLNAIDDLKHAHPNDPRLQDLRVALGMNPLVKEQASLMESYLKHKKKEEA